MVQRTMASFGVGVLAVVAACGPSPQDVRELRDGQRQILAKLADLDKKIEQVASRAAAPAGRPQADPNKVYEIPVGNSPVKGPAAAPVVLVEFSDFQ